MPPEIFVINPNGSAAVTAAIDRAVDPLRIAGGPPISCVAVEGAPLAIETQTQIDEAIGPLCRLALKLRAEAAAYVIACFSDPGLQSLREQTGRPVFGIGESAVLAAMTLGQRIGVISILPGSVPRHLRAFAAMGVAGRVVADRPIGLGVADLADSDRAMRRLIEVGSTLRDKDGADVLVMGCAGMADLRDALSSALAMPVVEPTQAATAMALGRARLGW